MTVAGTTEANATVTVLVNGAIAVTTTADGVGAYSVAVPLPPADGSYAVTVRASDLAGNASPVSAATDVVVDRTAPSAAIVTAPGEGVSLPPGTISITGTAEPGATVNVVVDATPHATTADASGAFQLDVELAAGNHFVTVTVVDPAGNASAGVDRSFVLATPPASDSGGGGCGCGPGGASAPEGLLLLLGGLGLFRRRRVPNPANLQP